MKKNDIHELELGREYHFQNPERNRRSWLGSCSCGKSLGPDTKENVQRDHAAHVAAQSR